MKRNAVYDFEPGGGPLLVSMPHSGTALPPEVLDRLSDSARALPDTDWHVPRLYDFVAELDASVLKAHYSRYLVDLNRPPDDRPLYPGQQGTGLCPNRLFDGASLYADGSAPSAAEVAARRERYWRPYHDQIEAELARIKGRHGYALLYDAHSIASRVPRLFDGRLPDLNLGTADGASCGASIETAIERALADGSYSHVVNGRFIGGYITRHYGDPDSGVHAVQMEIAQASYMEESPRFAYNPEKAAALRPVLRRALEQMLAVARSCHGGAGPRAAHHERG